MALRFCDRNMTQPDIRASITALGLSLGSLTAKPGVRLSVGKIAYKSKDIITAENRSLYSLGCLNGVT